MSMRDRETTFENVQAWLVARLAALLETKPDAITPAATFTDLGLSSVRAVELAAELEDHLGRELPATLVYDYPTVSAVARYVAELAAAEPVAGVPDSGD